MSDFNVFLTSLLGTIADFLWSPSVRWIVACCITLFLIKIIKMLLRLGDFDYIK